MKTIELNGKDRKVMDYKEFEALLNSVGMNWYGIKNWSRTDLEIFEDKLDGFTCEPVENGMRIWDRNFDYSDLN